MKNAISESSTPFLLAWVEMLFLFHFIFNLPLLGCKELEEVNTSTNTLSHPDSESTKLLILLVDGFRWDYYSRLSQKQQLSGFHQMVTSGVQVEYVEPIFPSLSYPSWTTLATGLYPSSHQIVGNYMLHIGDEEYPEAIFHLKDNSTKNEYWWKYAEPLWITATKAGHKVYMANFANCDVPFYGVSPAECTGYRYRDVNFKLREHLNKALTRFRQGYSLAMIYDDSIDHAGHTWGPNSNELRVAVATLDSLLQELFVNVRYHGLQDRVNLIVTSDHGMTSINEVNYVNLGDYITNPEDSVHKVIDYGAVVSIAAKVGKAETLYQEISSMPGVDVYKKQDIPEDFHYRESRFAHDLLLVAKPGYFIVGLRGGKQIPNDNKASSPHPYAATHGYHNLTDMRTVFYAKGPAFRKGFTHPPIRLEDEYQIFAELLELQACAHNGSWENVAGMFEERSYNGVYNNTTESNIDRNNI